MLCALHRNFSKPQCAVRNDSAVPGGTQSALLMSSQVLQRLPVLDYPDQQVSEPISPAQVKSGEIILFSLNKKKVISRIKRK